MKKLIMLFCLILSISLFTGCSFKFNIGDLPNFDDEENNNDFDYDWNTEDNSDDFDYDWNTEDNNDDFDYSWDDNEMENEKDDEDNKADDLKPNAKSFAHLARKGDASNPIKQGEAGIVTKYNYYDEIDNEAELYLRVKDTISSTKAKQLMDTYNETSFIAYNISEQSEWNGAIIEVDFKDFPSSKYSGTTLKNLLTSVNIVGPDGDNIEFNGYSYYMMTGQFVGAVNDSIEEASQGDVVELHLVYPLPKGYNKDFMIEISNKDYNVKTCFLVEQ